MFRGLGFVRRMATVANVDIDPNGTFKYILIKLTTKDDSAGSVTKNIVRGYAECPFHSDINDKVTEQLQKLKKEGAIKDWKTKVLGGGRIAFDADAKTINVYGYSQGYGKADHTVAVDLLKQVYPNHEITCTDEGY